MKLAFPALLLAVFFLGGRHQVRVIKLEPDAVTILHRDGGALIPLIMLPEELQKKFNYDAPVAKAAAVARQEADLENARALRAEHQQAMARKQAIVKTQEASDDSTKTASIAPVSYTDPSHHAMSDLVDPTQRLQDDISYDAQHHLMGYLVAHSSPSASPADPKHYYMSNLFDSGDPLSP
jgi:hypothetical protein